jgi:hypothetical protein
MDSSALRRRYVAAPKRADLRALRFHDLRHTFGSLAINYAPIAPVQAWMGHADVDTTMRYLHRKSRADDARLLSHAVRANGDAADGGPGSRRTKTASDRPAASLAVGVRGQGDAAPALAGAVRRGVIDRASDGLGHLC